MGDLILTQTNCDLLYRQGINPIRAQRKEGTHPADKLRESTIETVTRDLELEGCV